MLKCKINIYLLENPGKTAGILSYDKHLLQKTQSQVFYF